MQQEKTIEAEAESKYSYEDCDNKSWWTDRNMVDAERAAYIAGRSAQIEREKELQRKVDFFREATDKCREFVFGRNDIGHPNQPLWDAVYDRLTELEAQIESEKKKDAEIERLKGERAGLIKRLQEFISMHETGLLPNRFTYEDAKMELNSIGE